MIEKLGPTCPTCGQLWPRNRGKRACSLCAGPIRARDRWFFGLDGRPQHYHCDNPTSPRGGETAPSVQADLHLTREARNE